MADLSEATPRPWQQHGSLIWGGSGNSAAVICAVSEPRATRYLQYTELKVWSDDAPEAWANAGLIITAVNAHDDLIAALRQIEDMIRGCPDVPRAPDSLPQMVLAVTRAALAKAESHD